MTTATTLQEGCQGKYDTGRPGGKLPPPMPLHTVTMSVKKGSMAAPAKRGQWGGGDG